MDEAGEYEPEEPRWRRVPTLEPVVLPTEERGELPVSLVDGVLRVGSSYALAGVASFWTPYAPVAEARCGLGEVVGGVRRAPLGRGHSSEPRMTHSPSTASATAACSWAPSCSAARRLSTACAWRRRCGASASWRAPG